MDNIKKYYKLKNKYKKTCEKCHFKLFICHILPTKC